MDTLFSPVAHDALYPLPLACALDVFARLSCGERLFCMAVSKPWRAALSRGSLWRDVDLSTTSGEAVVNDGLLRCLSRVSRGHLRSLDVADRLHFDAAPLLGDIELTGKHTVSWDTLVLVVASQAATLRRLCLLRCVDMIVPGRLEALLESAPLLEHVEVDVACTPDNAHPLLLREHPFEALRMRTLRLGAEEGVESDAVSIEALSRGIEAHSGLLELTILRTPLQHGHVFSALAAASLHIVDLILSRCNLNSSSISGLVHLVDKGTLSKLFIFNDDIALFHEAEARAFAKAVCDNRTLTSLSLHRVCLWDILATGQAVVEALVGHPTLNILSLGANAVADAHRRVVGKMLGRLVSVNAPSLTRLNVDSCHLSDEGLRHFVASLQLWPPTTISDR